MIKKTVAVKKLKLILLPCPWWSRVTSSTTTAINFISAPLQPENEVVDSYQLSLL